MKNRFTHSSFFTAIDIGSNSFHMAIAVLEQQGLRPIGHWGEKVQLAAGMEDDCLAKEAIERGLACLQSFKAQIDTITQGGHIRVVGTHALRKAKNSSDFTAAAERILGCPVDIIEGNEEARLVYFGVAHTLENNDEPRLVLDVGGGSTEVIVGCGFDPSIIESLPMGCVSYLRFFPNGDISRANMQRAYHCAYQQLLTISERYSGQWRYCVGSSGTLLAIEQVLINYGLCERGISRQALEPMLEYLLRFDTINEVTFQGLKENRCSILAPGLAITMALFDALGIEFMNLSDGALREGVLQDMLVG